MCWPGICSNWPELVTCHHLAVGSMEIRKSQHCQSCPLFCHPHMTQRPGLLLGQPAWDSLQALVFAYPSLGAQFSHPCAGVPPSILASTASCRSVSGGRCLLRQQTWGNRFYFSSFPIPVLEEPTYVGPEGIPRVLGAEGVMAILPGKCLLGGGCSPPNGTGPDPSSSSLLSQDGQLLGH